MDIKSQLREKELGFLLDKRLTKEVGIFGIRHGFLRTDFRTRAFNLLFRIDMDSAVLEAQAETQRHAATKVEEMSQGRVILNDVDRSFNLSVSCARLDEEAKAELKTQLLGLLKVFFLTHTDWDYYQGFNSIAETFLIAFGAELARVYLARFSDLFLQKFLTVKQIGQALEAINEKITRIVRSETKVEFEPEQLALTAGWVVSLLSHSLERPAHPWRIWDFLICLKLSLNEPKVLAEELPLELSKSKVLSQIEQKSVEKNLKRLAPPKKEDMLIEYVISKILVYFINREGSLSSDEELRFNFIKDIPLNRLEHSDIEVILLRSLSYIQYSD